MVVEEKVPCVGGEAADDRPYDKIEEVLLWGVGWHVSRVLEQYKIEDGREGSRAPAWGDRSPGSRWKPWANG